MLKKFLIGTFVVVALAFAMPASASYDFGSTTLRLGSRGNYVVTLQTVVGATPADGVFGPMTQAAVKAWQASNGLVADGIFGPLSMAKANLGLGGTTGTTLPAGCQAGWVVNPMTGASCVTTQLPAGCMPGYLFSPTSGAKCVAGATPTPGNLTGGAGDITLDDSSRYTNEDVEEGESDVEVLAFKVEADDESDVEITSIKVSLENADSGSSADLDDYLDEVTVWFDGEKVGDAEVDDFSESSDVWTKSITLDGVVIRAGDEEEIVVAVSALNNIDSDDFDADWSIDVVSVRFLDAEGVVTTIDSSGDGLEQSFDMVEEGDGEELIIKSSSNDPDSATLLVEEDEESDWYEVFVFKVEAEESDFDLEELVLTVDLGTATFDAVVSDVKIEIDGEEFDDYSVASGTTALATLTFDLDGDYTLDADSTEEVTVHMMFNGSEGNYTAGTETVKVSTVSISGEGVDDYDEDKVINGETHTLNTSVATLSAISWTKAEGTGAASIDLFFTLEAGDDDITGFEITDVVETKTNISAEGVLTKISGSATESPTGTFAIDSGDSANFRVRYTVSTTGGEVNVTTIFGQTVPESKRLSPTAYYQ